MLDRRIDMLRAATERMKNRVFPVAVPTEGDDDVSQLAVSLSDLAGELERAFGEASLLLDITQRINAGFLLDEVLDYVYEVFRSVIPYDRIGFSLLDDDQNTIRAYWARTEADEVQITKGYGQTIEGSSLAPVIETGEPRILNDLEAYLADHPRSDSTRRIVAEGMRSSLTCPLVVMGKPIGVMFFSSMQTGTYDNVHVAVFNQIAGQLAVVVEKSRLYQRVLEENERADTLLLNILPSPIARRLKDGEHTIADRFESVSVLFADLVGFTTWSAALEPGDLVGILNGIFRAFDELTDRHGVEKVKTIGDAYMLASGLPTPRDDHAAAAADMALDLIDVLADHRTSGGEPMAVRVGIHSGPVVAGVIGTKKFIYDLWGDTVNVASRMESHGAPGRVHVSAVTRRLLGEAYRFEERGEIEVKGRGPMSTYFLDGRA